jgi:hypothetical protein
MLLVLRRQRNILKPLGGTKVWEDVFWVVSALESAHPSIAPKEGPQLEYPWEDVYGIVRWPARDLRVALALGSSLNPLAARVLHFADLMAQQFDALFA